MARTLTILAAVVLLVLAVLAAIVGVLYLQDTAHALPSFLPGHRARGQHHYDKRAVAAFVVAGVLLVAAGFGAAFSRKPPAYR